MFFSCSKSGIIDGGSYISDKEGQIHAFYLYDFVSINDIQEHARTLDHNLGEIMESYYFSHNSNIPSQSLRLSKNFKDATEVIKTYAFNIKYAYQKDVKGEARFVDCVLFLMISYVGVIIDKY